MGCTLAKRECLNKAASTEQRRSLHALRVCIYMLFAFVNGSRIWKKCWKIYEAAAAAAEIISTATHTPPPPPSPPPPPGSTSAEESVEPQVKCGLGSAPGQPAPRLTSTGAHKKWPRRNIFSVRPNRYKADVNGGDNAAGGTFIHAGAAAEALIFALVMTLWYVYLAIMTHAQILCEPLKVLFVNREKFHTYVCNLVFKSCIVSHKLSFMLIKQAHCDLYLERWREMSIHECHYL
jgi:hypothetical protein